MRPAGRAEQIERICHVSRPVAKGIIDSVFQCSRTAFDSDDFRTTEFHLVDVDALPLDICDSHKDFGLHPEQGADHGGGQAVLAGAGLGDQLGLAHIFCQKALAERVVDFVGAAVKQVFAFEIHVETDVLAESLRVIKRAGPAGVVFRKLRKLRHKFRVFIKAIKSLFQFFQHRNQNLGDIEAAIISEPSSVFHIYPLKCRILSNSFFIFLWSFLPGSASMPLHTSIP